MKKHKQFFVSIYKMYPIYEPAEGGYYYDGISLESNEDFQTLRQARLHLQQIAKEEDLIKYSDDKYVSPNYHRSKYIGAGYYAVVETELGSEESGKQIYC